MSKALHPEYWFLACALMLVLLAGSYRLDESPAIWFDEGMLTQVAENLATHGVQEIQIAPGSFVPTSFITSGYPLLFPVSIAYRLFGVGVSQGRAVMVLFMLLFVLSAYVLTRLLHGGWYAGWGVLLLATLPELYGNGKSVLGEVPGLFFLTLCLLALVFLERSKFHSLWAYAGVGVAAGLCVATKPIFLLLLPALALAWLCGYKKITIRWRGVALAIFFFLVLLVLWIHLQFGPGDSVFSVISLYENPLGVTNFAEVALQNFIAFFTQVTPAYTVGMLVLWALTGIWCIMRNRPLATAELVGWLFCAAIALNYLHIEGWYRYLFPATAFIFFMPYALATIYEITALYAPVLSPLKWVPYMAICLLIAAQTYQLAHNSYVAGYYGSTTTNDLQTALSKLSTQASIFVYNVPETVILLPSDNYYQYFEPSPRIAVGADELAQLRTGAVQYVLASVGTNESQPELFSHYRLMTEIDHKYALFVRQ